jgi:hypothetical protein
MMPHHAMLNRVRAEYLETPGLRLTPEQTGRLCGVERALCQRVLDALVVEKFLCAGHNHSGHAQGRLEAKALSSN